MKKAHWLALFLALGLLLPLFSILGGRRAQPASAGTNPAAAQSPILGPLLDIWTGDGVDNYSPAVAYNSLHDEYLVVWWNEQGPNTWDIYARRVGSDGTLKSWFSVAWGAGQKRWQPAVAYSPAQDEYLIVYSYEVTSDDYDLLAKRVKWDGSWMSPEFVINYDADKQWHPAVAYNSQDDEYLVVYYNWWAGGLADIAAQRVTASDGSLSLLSWANVATGAGEYRFEPDVAYNPARNQYLIAYGYESSAGSGILGKVAAASLAGVGAAPEIPICDIALATRFGVDVAAGPDEYLVVWSDSLGVPGSDIHGRRVDGDGTPQGPSSGFPIATTLADDHHSPDVAYGAGYGYLVTSVYYFVSTLPAPGDPGDVYGRYVMPGQDEATGGEFAIDNSINRQTVPAVACAPSGECLVVEMHNTLPHPGENYEIRGRFVMPWRIFLPLVLKNY